MINLTISMRLQSTSQLHAGAAVNMLQDAARCNVALQVHDRLEMCTTNQR